MNFSSYIKAQVSFGFAGDKVIDLFFGEVGAVLLMRWRAHVKQCLYETFIVALLESEA